MNLSDTIKYATAVRLRGEPGKEFHYVCDGCLNCPYLEGCITRKELMTRKEDIIGVHIAINLKGIDHVPRERIQGL